MSRKGRVKISIGKVFIVIIVVLVYLGLIESVTLQEGFGI